MLTTSNEMISIKCHTSSRWSTSTRYGIERRWILEHKNITNHPKNVFKTWQHCYPQKKISKENSRIWRRVHYIWVVLSCDTKSAMEIVPPKFDNIIVSELSLSQKINLTTGECISLILPSPPEDESVIDSILNVTYAKLQPWFMHHNYFLFVSKVWYNIFLHG